MRGINPKDAQGLKKVPLGLVPAAGLIYAALAMWLGALVYGPYNWRRKKVLMTVYLDAIERHLLALRDGEDGAVDSRAPQLGPIPHLGSIAACAAILADAIEGGFLVDDRPPCGPGSRLLDHHTLKKSNGSRHVIHPIR